MQNFEYSQWHMAILPLLIKVFFIAFLFTYIITVYLYQFDISLRKK